MSDQVQAVSRPWRRYPHFRARGLIVLVLAVGAGLGWLIRSARIQREAVAAIEKAGGSVDYDWEWTNGEHIAGAKPRAPRWLVDRIGVDYFGHVTDVWLCSSWAAPEAVMEQVGRLTRLRRLHLDRSSISGAGLAHLKGLTKLSDLGLGGNRLGGNRATDAGLDSARKSHQLLPGSNGVTGTIEPGSGLLMLRALLKGPSVGAPACGFGAYIPPPVPLGPDADCVATPEGAGGATGAVSPYL